MEYGLLGEHLGHSFSPQIHKMIGGYDYGLFERDPDTLDDFFANGTFKAINVTIPYKKAVIPYCKTLSPQAAEIGSVNTIRRMPDGSYFGDNTDYYGFTYMVKHSGVSVEGKKCIVFGDGGVAPTVRTALRDMGAGEVITVSRKGENNFSNLDRHYDAAVLVNATPVGTYPNNGVSVTELAPFTKLEAAYDLVYNPAVTEFLRQAAELGAVAVNGLGMLVAQAKRAVEIFLDTEVSDNIIEEVRKKIAFQNMNIALIGMAGSGKTTTGKALAEKLGREFVDCDDLIPVYAGKSIQDIFAEDGEEVFRQIETAVLSDVCKKGGLVIATGGGVVTRPENLPLLRQNSVTVLLHRPVEDLPSDGRPLSQKHGVSALYEKRKPLYEAWGEHRIECNGVEESVQQILEALGV
ncbi:MAG: shikimate kinase [Oscillospiraceae bacterium]|nr:shikimate kinase [Oscillospiraceae bacterium]